MAYGGTNEAWIVGAVRTPIGRHGGALAAVRPDDLGAVALEALMEHAGVPAGEVEDVYFGCANGAGEDNRNVARMSLLLAGFPEEVGGVTVNRLCGSGLDAVAQAARAVMLGEANAYVGGGWSP
jgi:acetyl-CoA acyltransferase